MLYFTLRVYFFNNTKSDISVYYFLTSAYTLCLRVQLSETKLNVKKIGHSVGLQIATEQCAAACSQSNPTTFAKGHVTRLTKLV